MSLPLLIAINVVADIALIAGLAYAMSRAARLTPHVAPTAGADAQMTPGLSLAPSPSPRQTADRPADARTARDRTPAAKRTGSPATAAAGANR